jgi:8-oxo-dGTP pyrophosphatase MutT (NUDIX family)
VGKKKKNEKASKPLREFSSGGVVFRKTQDSKDNKLKTLWLVARANPSKEIPLNVWRLPKGWIDDKEDGKYPGPISSGEIKATDEDLRNAAVREVQEEGGVLGKVITKIGNEMFVINSKLRGGRVLKFVTFYLMEWKRDLDVGFGNETSEVVWLDYDDARKKITYSGEKKILDKAKKVLDSMDQYKV